MKVLIDTSIWIDHLRSSDPGLERLIREHKILSHPFVIGELAMGGMKHRLEVLSSLQRMQTSVEATDAEVLQFIEEHRLYGQGVGYVDVHLLVSARLTPETQFWTRDKRLLEIAVRLRLAFDATTDGQPIQ